jgi:DNA transformation protein
MFSGFGISVDGVNFGLALREAVFLRVDASNVARYEAEGCAPFQYQTRAKTVTVASYWQLPERLYDDPDELAERARASLAAAERAALAKARKPSSGKTKAVKRPPARTASAVKRSRRSPQAT